VECRGIHHVSPAGKGGRTEEATMAFPSTLYDFPRSLLGAHLRIARLASGRTAGADLEARVRRLEAERAVRELVHRYEYAQDAKSIEDLLSLYLPDAVLVNSFGTWAGLDAIRVSHDYDASKSEYSFHHVTTSTTVVNDSADEAWLSGYLYNFAERDGETFGTIATCVFHLRQTGEGWRIAECRTGSTGRHALERAQPLSRAGRPAPSRPETSIELQGG
jgi:uncharacterized protein (TIGR02246 family)